MRKELDAAKSLFARVEKSDESWYHDDRPVQAQADLLLRRAQKRSDTVAQDVMTNVVQGDDFIYDAAADAQCGRQNSTARQVVLMRKDAATYLRAADIYIEMGARDLARYMPNPVDWSPPVPEVHAEEDTGCPG
jgi:hypothetical protein